METASRLAPLNPASSLLGELGLLADGTRGLMVAWRAECELAVVGVCDSLALPQSTVSRHLKLLADAGWVAARRDGTSRRYALTIDRIPEGSPRPWDLLPQRLT